LHQTGRWDMPERPAMSQCPSRADGRAEKGSDHQTDVSSRAQPPGRQCGGIRSPRVRPWRPDRGGRSTGENKIRGSFQNEGGFGFQNEQAQKMRAVA